MRRSLASCSVAYLRLGSRSQMRCSLKRIAVLLSLRTWAIACVLLALFAIAARTIYQTERSARLNLKERFHTRVEIAETFLQRYVREILERERSVAELELADAQISAAAFNAVVNASGFTASVVLDSAGKILQVYTATPELRGFDMA